MSETLSVRFLKLPHHGELRLPYYASPGASGMDLLAAVEQDVTIQPGSSALIPSGLCAEIAAGFEIQIRSRSGLAAKNGVFVLNSPGTVDSDYRGEIKVILMNLGRAEFTVHRADRIAQMVISPVIRGRPVEAAALQETDRGAGGFGHSGIQG